MNRRRFQVKLLGSLILVLCLILLGGLVSISAKDVTPPVQEVDSTVIQSDTAYKLEHAVEAVIEPKTSLSKASQHDFSGRFTGLAWMAPLPNEVGANCTQLLGNSELTVSGGSFAPWFILDPEVYYTDSTFTSAPHSVLMEAEDEGLTSDTDAFGQVVEIPAGDLTKVTVEYNTASVDSNGNDLQGGAIWTVDSEGYIDEYVTEWIISDSDNIWERHIFEIVDNGRLNQMEDKEIVLIFFFDTDDQGKAETVFFDDVTLTACSEELDLPAAPSNLTAQAVSYKQVVLDWTDNSDNEDGFKIEHSLTGTSGWTQIATTAATGYAPNDLECDTRHYFRVRAYNSSGNSAYSNTADDTTFPCESTTKYSYLPVALSNYWAGFFDDFSDPNSGWASRDSDYWTLGYLNGEYQILLKNPQGSGVVTPDLILPADFSIEVDARQANNITSSYGLMFGIRWVSNTYEGYQIILYPATQEYLMNKRNVDGSWSLLKDWTFRSAIHQGMGTNHLRIDRIGTLITLHINGTLVTTLTDSSFTSAGRDAGVRAYSYESAPADVRFDNFSATPP